MIRHRISLWTATGALLLACSSDDGINPHPVDDRPDVVVAEAAVDAPSDSGLRPFGAPHDPGSGGILVTASGEVLALRGYAFPPASPSDSAFVDGWEVHFDRVLVTFDHVRLAEGPDTAPTDQSQTGATIAAVDGPWAVDLHRGGPLAGKEGAGDQSIPIASISHKSDGSALDPTRRYAFGFDVIGASPNAYDVNLDDAGRADYREMITKGWAVLYVGTATFRGGATTSGSLGSGGSCASPTIGYAWEKLPTTISFRFGFRSPTTYINCQNPDNAGTPLGSDEHARGLQVDPSKAVVAQITMHTDHPFWESVVHDTPAHLDMIAARFVGRSSASATLDDLVGKSPTAITDSAGVALPWRSCVSTYTARAGGAGFDPHGVTISRSGDPHTSLRDLSDFMVYNQSTQGHLNADGLCFVHRNYASPP